ncbi:MAG: NAD(P)-binding domain-containing protein [Zetaproteobacteria bacterium]|nr:NAD(P)-binding domain-containing protein [Zetaproteobacteria bacterium]
MKHTYLAQAASSSHLQASGKKLVIIGGGFAGIYTLKHALEAGLDAIVIEKSSQIGGQWVYDPNKLGGVNQDTETVSSKLYMSPTDFPMPKTYPDFPSADQVLEHLQNYVHHFKLQPYIRYNTTIKHLSRTSENWKVQTDQETMAADFVVVATGMNAVPRIPDLPQLRDFQNPMMHSSQFKHLDLKALQGKNVLIVGGSDTASDIAEKLKDHSHVYVSMRNGAWFQPKYLKYYNFAQLDPTADHTPADMVVNQFLLTMVKWWGHDLPEKMGFVKRFEKMMGKSGSGIPEWESEDKYFGSVWTKSPALLDAVREGKVIPKRGILSATAQEICFEGEDSTPVHFDLIILCTGYRHQPNFPIDAPQGQRYKLVFDSQDPSLAWVGYVRPYVTGVPMIAELQSRWVAAAFSGQCTLPEPEQMEREIILDQQAHQQRFPGRPEFLVDPYQYMEFVAQQFGQKPGYMKILWAQPLLFMDLMFNTWTHYQYRLLDQDPQKRELAEEQIKQLRQGPIRDLLYSETYRTMRSLAPTPLRRFIRRWDRYLLQTLFGLHVGRETHADPHTD